MKKTLALILTFIIMATALIVQYRLKGARGRELGRIFSYK